MNRVEVLEVNSDKWQSIVNSSFGYDFHQTSCFHRIDCGSNEKPLLFVAYNEQDEYIALPLIVKSIIGTTLFDATSVYGYAGPIASKPFDEIPLNLQAFFKKEFIAYCQTQQIITVFSRLHPLIDTVNFFESFGSVKDLNKTVAIDLTLPKQDQRKAYRKSNKSEINQLRNKKGYTVHQVDAKNEAEIREFVEIYQETMDRLEAKDQYYFDFDYFFKLLNNSCFTCSLLVAYKEEKMTAGAIFTETKSIMQYHLAGTREAYIHDAPMKLILDEARLLGTDKSLTYLHLGGGVGGSDEDPLFRFKSGFSKNFFQFSVWNLIVDEEKYRKLIKERNLENDNSSFFPLYRKE